jgi:hypothetical protein
MTLPNFLIIGAAKSGTTAIYTYIKQHPQIFMSEQKELRYFSYSRNPAVQPPKDYIHPSVTTLDQYKQHFKSVSDESVIGESSPTYLYTPETAERIKALLPDVKLFAILRNPIDRAYSAYTHALRDWKEPAASFDEALQQEEDRIAAGWGMLWHYKAAGLYYQQLMPYFNIFDKDRIKVVLYDDLVADTNQLLKDLFGFLNVDEYFHPDTTSRPNVSGFPKNQFAHNVMKILFLGKNPVKSVSRKIIPNKLRYRFVKSLRHYNLEKRALSQETRKSLIEYYQNDILLLSDLINRDLSHWISQKN